MMKVLKLLLLVLKIFTLKHKERTNRPALIPYLG